MKRKRLKVRVYTDWNPQLMDYHGGRFYTVVSPDVFLNPEKYKSESTKGMLERLKKKLPADFKFSSNFCVMSFKRK